MVKSWKTDADSVGVMGCVVQVDLFFFREPEESKDRDDEEGGAPEFAPVEYAAPALGVGGDAQWGPEAAEAGQWEPEAAVPAGVPAAEWVAPAAAPAAGWDVGATSAAPAGWDTAAAAAPAGWEGTAAPAPAPAAQWEPAAQ